MVTAGSSVDASASAYKASSAEGHGLSREGGSDAPQGTSQPSRADQLAWEVLLHQMTPVHLVSGPASGGGGETSAFFQPSPVSLESGVHRTVVASQVSELSQRLIALPPGTHQFSISLAGLGQINVSMVVPAPQVVRYQLSTEDKTVLGWLDAQKGRITDEVKAALGGDVEITVSSASVLSEALVRISEDLQ